MSEPKTVTYLVITEDDAIEYTTDNLDKAEGYAECLQGQQGVACRIAQVVRE